MRVEGAMFRSIFKPLRGSAGRDGTRAIKERDDPVVLFLFYFFLYLEFPQNLEFRTVRGGTTWCEAVILFSENFFIVSLNRLTVFDFTFLTYSTVPRTGTLHARAMKQFYNSQPGRTLIRIDDNLLATKKKNFFSRTL